MAFVFMQGVIILSGNFVFFKSENGFKRSDNLDFNLKGMTPELFCQHRKRSKMASQQQQQQQAGGPMSQPGLQQPASIQQQQQQQLSQQQDFDPVHRFKMLIPQLKESLQVMPN